MAQKTNRSAFDLENTTIETIAKEIALVYSSVDIVESPLYRWFNIINDMAILDEDIRRNRIESAIDRTGRILMRILSFIGHYLYIQHPTEQKKCSASDLVARTLRATSFGKYFGRSGLREGPSKWIYAKYPYSCAKCGCNPCKCPVTPWIFEERRENPGPFLKFSSRAEKNREKLKQKKNPEFTLPSLLDFFRQLYYNQYYKEDPWKLIMHLNEELGEATVELARMELLCLARNRGKMNPREIIREIEKQTEQELKERFHQIKDPEIQKQMKRKASRDFGNTIKKFKTQKDFLWEYTMNLIALRLKDELADVFSWLSVIIQKLAKMKKNWSMGFILRTIVMGRYLKHKGKLDYFNCAWCGEQECHNYCLLSHEITEELVEKIIKF